MSFRSNFQALVDDSKVMSTKQIVNHLHIILNGSLYTDRIRYRDSFSD